MTNKLTDSHVILNASSEEQKSAVIQALQNLENRRLVLIALFENQDDTDSFLESVVRNLLSDVQHPFELADQIDPSDLIDLMVGEIQSCVAE